MNLHSQHVRCWCLNWLQAMRSFPGTQKATCLRRWLKWRVAMQVPLATLRCNSSTENMTVTFTSSTLSMGYANRPSQICLQSGSSHLTSSFAKQQFIHGFIHSCQGPFGSDVEKPSPPRLLTNWNGLCSLIDAASCGSPFWGKRVSIHNENINSCLESLKLSLLRCRLHTGVWSLNTLLPHHQDCKCWTWQSHLKQKILSHASYIKYMIMDDLEFVCPS